MHGPLVQVLGAHDCAAGVTQVPWPLQVLAPV
jgi:hypothetical protein